MLVCILYDDEAWRGSLCYRLVTTRVFDVVWYGVASQFSSTGCVCVAVCVISMCYYINGESEMSYFATGWTRHFMLRRRLLLL